MKRTGVVLGGCGRQVGVGCPVGDKHKILAHEIHKKNKPIDEFYSVFVATPALELTA